MLLVGVVGATALATGAGRPPGPSSVDEIILRTDHEVADVPAVPTASRAILGDPEPAAALRTDQ